MPAMIELLQQSPPVAIAAASLLAADRQFRTVITAPVMLNGRALRRRRTRGRTADADAAAPPARRRRST
jgi:hypothetical protein